MSVFQITEYKLWKSLKQNDQNAPVDAGVPMKQEIIQNKHEIFDNDRICRVCTNPADIPLTEKIHNILIMSAIRTITSISIAEDDYYPKYICNNCLEELKIAYQFKRKCEASDMMFRKAIPSETLAYTKTRPMIMHDFSLIIHNMAQNRLKTQEVTVKENQSDDENAYSIFNDDYKADDSGNDSDNVVISSLCKNSKDLKKTQHMKLKTKCQESRRKSSRSKKSKIKIVKVIRTRDKDEESSPDIQSRIVKLLNITNSSVVIRKRNAKTPVQKKTIHHECKRCEVKFNSKEEYLKHTKENNCMYHPCPLCGKLVINLLMHQKIVHLRADKYTCEQCGKIYYSSSALRNHLHVHKESREFSCDLCPYKGKRKSYLVCHMRVHTGEHRYLCSKCPAKFTNPSNLRKHQLVHYNKKFECNKCKKTFRQEKVLLEHYDSAHLNIRYRCSICSRDLCTRRKLLSHELRVHKREKHKLFQDVQKVVITNDSKLTSNNAILE